VDANWTCPFCSLLCDGFALESGAAGLLLNGSDCPQARAGLAAHAGREAPAAWIDGAEVPSGAAEAEAARRLAQWREPLFGGMGTDMAGARALFRLAVRTAAVCDHADGETLAQGLRALQDRGQFHTTLAEVRARADLVVCVGTRAVDRYPEFFRRCGMAGADSACRQLVFLGVPPPERVPPHLQALHIAGSGDLLADLQQLAALVATASCRAPDEQLANLALALRAARYAVLVWEAAALPPHGALAAEMLQRIVATLDRTTRAATFALGGSDGAGTVQQVFTWLSGLPLRSRLGAEGATHEPLRFAGARLLADRAVDGLLWVWSWTPDRLPPGAGPPRIVLGPPGMGVRLREEGAARDCIFLPVATPGLNAAGHLFRTDGVVVPLVAAREDGLPGVDRVASRLLARMEAGA
jgi:formylmethanofuran dehydrogenase subunit B